MYSTNEFLDLHRYMKTFGILFRAPLRVAAKIKLPQTYTAKANAVRDRGFTP